MGRHLAYVVAAVILTCPAVGGEPGSVKGTYTLDGKTYTPDRVYAISVPSLKDPQKEDVRVIFSVGPQDEGKLLSEGTGGGLSLTVTIGPGWPDVDPSIGFRYGNGSSPTPKDLADLGAPPYSTSNFSGLPDVMYESRGFSSKVGQRISGKLSIPLPAKREAGQLGAELDFDVSILGKRPKV